MSSYELSQAADQRISDIYAYSLQNWGVLVAQDYFAGLHECFEWLADNPELGRKFYEFRRYEYRSHIVFYSVQNASIRIEQIYHKSQNVDDILS